VTTEPYPEHDVGTASAPTPTALTWRHER